MTYPQNGAVLRTYIVLASRLGDQKPMRFQVVPYVGEFTVPGFIIPLPDDTYKARSEQMVRNWLFRQRANVTRPNRRRQST